MACKRSAVRSRVAPPNSCYKKQKGHRIAVAFLFAPAFIFPIFLCFSCVNPLLQRKSPRVSRNAVHLSGAALRSTGKRVFDIFTALGLDGLGRFSMNMTPMQPRNSANLRGVCAGDSAPAITAIWFAMN